MNISAFDARETITDTFGDLPDALIHELLTKVDTISENASDKVQELIEMRDSLRERALGLGLIETAIPPSNSPYKSVAGVDGSAVTRRLASLEINAAAALAVDGVSSLSNDGSANGAARGQELPDLPHHFEVPRPTKPLRYSSEIAYGLMFCMEYLVAEEVKRDLVMLDGAFSTGMVAISLGLKSADAEYDDLSNALKRRWVEESKGAISDILSSDRMIALPKRTSGNEFATQTRLFGSREVDTNGRSTASLILEPGEFSGPFNLETHTFYIDPVYMTRQEINDLDDLYSQIKIVYYKPHSWSHAYRIELPPAIAEDATRLHAVLDRIKLETTNPAMMEPYPLYVADRFVKSLAKGIDSMMAAVRREVIAKSSEAELAHQMMTAYRSDPQAEEAVP